ncbi:transposase [Paracraurococcus lichenis]|uniref:transposase n=1 Tax=Paracraurococcus lichenis TaxID=3064888 RepID=UPI00351CDB21
MLSAFIVINFVSKNLRGSRAGRSRGDLADRPQGKLPRGRQPLWGDQFWSPSYCVVSCGGAPLDIIKRYVEQQRVPDRKRRSKKDA